MHRVPLAFLVLAALLATGCLGFPMDAPADAMPVPEWSVGDWWAFQVRTTSDAAVEHVRFDVVGVHAVPRGDGSNGTFYHVRVTRNDAVVGEELRDARNLDVAYYKWGEPCGPLSRGSRTLPCNGGPHELEFPLLDGAAWTAHSGGDVREEWPARAERVVTPAGVAYSVTLDDATRGGAGARCVTLAPDVGWLVEEKTRAAGDGFPGSHRVLVDHRYARAPDAAASAAWARPDARACP